jgi:P27 family predicted phage terminase small subunit
MRGRKPKPTELRRLEGNPGHRPLPKPEETVPAAIPNCPGHIQGEARAEWRRISSELVRLSLVSRIDKAALALYCQLWQRWIEAENAVRELGLVVTAAVLREYLRKQKGQSGGETKASELLFPDVGLETRDFPAKNPYLSIAESCMDRMQKILVEFGMTPSSRARVKATPEKTSNEIEDLLSDGADTRIDGLAGVQ